MREEHYIKLKKTREEKGLTQAEVATYLGVSRQAISQWERGLAYPDIGKHLCTAMQEYQLLSFDACVNICHNNSITRDTL